ncbi:MAG: CBS domain-containing protein [Bryobacterales bacterium]|nr:CBS domain-containing protein [Bryobacterales bacterium]MCZ2146630.1 CBS domain-containing protein [Bryobacterales bacterium]
MTVKDLLNPHPVTITLEETFGGALKILLERHIRALPVLDSAGIYRGMFYLYDLWELLLPKAATLEGANVTDLSFMPGSLEELREKTLAAGPRSVIEFLKDKEAPAIHPETSVKEAILMLYHHDGVLPVVEKKTRRFLGILTPWEILNRLHDKE